MLALIDESQRRNRNLYVLVVALVPYGEIDSIRDTLRRVLPHGQLRAHWRDDSEERRIRFLNVIPRCCSSASAYVATGVPSAKQERARALFLMSRFGT